MAGKEKNPANNPKQTAVGTAGGLRLENRGAWVSTYRSQSRSSQQHSRLAVHTGRVGTAVPAHLAALQVANRSGKVPAVARFLTVNNCRDTEVIVTRDECTAAGRQKTDQRAPGARQGPTRGPMTTPTAPPLRLQSPVQVRPRVSPGHVRLIMCQPEWPHCFSWDQNLPLWSPRDPFLCATNAPAIRSRGFPGHGSS